MIDRGIRQIGFLSFIIIMMGVFVSTYIAWAYDTPATWSEDKEIIIFKESYVNAPHTWFIVKAIELLREDGYIYQADMAERYLLPMLEGATFCDVWGDPDYDGSTLLHYYCPDRPDQNYGYGSAPGFNNATWDYAKHPFYGYENAAEYAQNRYEAAIRAATGQWGVNRQDHMAGWVVERPGGQEDPISGRWAEGTEEIDNPSSRFGSGQTPQSALTDLLVNHTNYQVIFPQHPGDFLSRIYVPTKEVFDHAPEWLDDHFGSADDIETYFGYDGHGSVIYAAWTLDTGSPKVFYVPANSKENAFFLLGLALHLVQDCTLPVHTIDSSIDFFHIHNNIEDFANKPLREELYWNGKLIRDSLPALTLQDFTDLYEYPPPKCVDLAPDPASDYKQRWYGEVSAYEYARKGAEISHKYMEYIHCINTENDANWPCMGFFTALELDLAIKATAGLIHKFFSEVGNIPEWEIYDGSGGPLCSTQAPYFIVGNIIIPAGKTLTICPNVTLEFTKYAKITAYGTLHADGKAGTIRFISKDDNTKGMKISSQFILKNGGELKMGF